MRAAYYEQTGSSDVIQIGEIPTPDPGPAEVRVKIAVSGVNPTDWKSRAGATRGATGERQGPNPDGAGVIDAGGGGGAGARLGPGGRDRRGWRRGRRVTARRARLDLLRGVAAAVGNSRRVQRGAGGARSRA